MNGGIVAEDTKVGVPKPTVARSRTGERSILSDDPPRPRAAITATMSARPPGPRFSEDTTADMLRMYGGGRRPLRRITPTRRPSQVRIPIDRAMQIVAKKGLPHRDTPASRQDRIRICRIRLKRSQPYMATPDPT